MNTRAFINEFGRDPKDYIEVKGCDFKSHPSDVWDPKDYIEVKAWIRSIIEKRKEKSHAS